MFFIYIYIIGHTLCSKTKFKWTMDKFFSHTEQEVYKENYETLGWFEFIERPGEME